MRVARRLGILTKLASLRSRIFFKAAPNYAGGTKYRMMLATDRGKAVDVGYIDLGKDKSIKYSHLEPKFRGTGLGRLMYSRVAQAEGNLKGDKIQSGLAHGVYQALAKPRRASSKKPLAMSAKKMREKGLEPTGHVATKTTMFQLPGAEKPTVPLKIYRPGSKQAKEQARRMVTAGEDPKNWTTKAQVERWKNATGSKELAKIRASPAATRGRSLDYYTGMGLRPGRYESVGGKRPTKPSPIKLDNRLAQLYPDDPKKAKAELEKIRKRSGYFVGLPYAAAPTLSSAKRLSELRKSNPKDFGRPYGTVMLYASPETRARHAAKLRSEGRSDDVPLNLYSTSFRNKKARDAKHLYTSDRMSPRYQRMMRRRGNRTGLPNEVNKRPPSLLERLSLFSGLRRLFGRD